jgi:(1->4)-alpha-D-glucan 1-alpha-D-glucosylmutase
MLRGLHPTDERLKLGIMQRLLHTRRANASLFTRGSYVPLAVRGAQARHLVAFARRDGNAIALTVAPRLSVSRLDADGRPSDWGDTEIVLPEGASAGPLRSVLTDEEVPIRGDSSSIAASSVLTQLPLAVLLRS